jgi:hypothetical protein
MTSASCRSGLHFGRCILSDRSGPKRGWIGPVRIGSDSLPYRRAACSVCRWPTGKPVPALSRECLPRSTLRAADRRARRRYIAGARQALSRRANSHAHERVRRRPGKLSGQLGNTDWLDGDSSAGDLLMVTARQRLGQTGHWPTIRTFRPVSPATNGAPATTALSPISPRLCARRRRFDRSSPG